MSEHLLRSIRKKFARRGLPLHCQRLTVVALLLVCCVSMRAAYGQAPSGTLMGTVTDQSGAVVPDASVVLKNESTGALRRTVSNTSGFFTIVAIPAGAYTVTIETPGFAKWEQAGIVFHQGDVIKVPDIVLKVSAVIEEIKVGATPDILIPVNSGEKSEVITSREIENLSIVGRNAVELLKILPGVVNTGGQTGGVRFTGEFTMFTTAGGAIGSYNVAGTRSETLDINSDGANVIDPGCNCGSAVTPNVNMIQEVKVQVANFSAENTRGPVVFQTVTKAGGSEFHGQAYLHARNHIFNSQDWQANRFGLPKPEDSFYYPGFNIGGPLLIPGTDFNRKRDKVFFFFGAEWMRQNVDLAVHPAVVPTAKMRKGDFSELAQGLKLNGYDVSGLPSSSPEAQKAFNCCGPLIPANGITPQGVIDPGLIDRGGQILLNLYPLPNRDPAQNNGFNYVSDIVNRQHRTQQRARVDFNISDNTKLYTVFNHEDEQFPFPYITWWSQPNSVPYPSEVVGKNRSFSTSNSLVQVLDPTVTNEILFGATYLNLPNFITDRSKVSRQALGYPYKGVFKTSDLIPNITDWGGGVADIVQPGGFDPSLFANKWIISLGDNFAKVQGTHSLKFGAYFQLTTNVQPSFQDNHGDLQPTNWGGTSTGNAYADLLMGRIGAYGETTINPVGHGHTREFAFYAHDSWKVAQRLTLELGARFYHVGMMYDTQGHYAGFDPKRYDPKAPIDAYTGVVAPYRGDRVPSSIFNPPALRVGPRLGFAWDLRGNGNTVIRGGAGEFLYRDVGNITENAVANPPLVRSINLGFAPGTLAQLDQIDPTKNVPRPTLNVLDPTDRRVSTTYSWSFTISQRLPWKTVLETSYVGNTSRNQMTQEQRNINVVPEGAMFGFPLGTNPDNYRPFKSYSRIIFYQHLLSQNYNALQVTAKRWTGRVNYSLAYTFSKALGIGGNYKGYSNQVDSFDMRRRSYGPLDYDRTHILSAAYNILLPDATRTPGLNRILNGWQISGISQLESGGPFQQRGHRIQTNGTMANGKPISPINVAGTPDTNPQAFLTCDPRNGRGENQYANPNCFAAPEPGRNGMYQMPYLKEPATMNHDISLFKNFPLSPAHESQNLQFRFSMFNLLNHPIWFFQTGDPGLELNFKNGVVTSNSSQKFGRPVRKSGKRAMELGLIFSF